MKKYDYYKEVYDDVMELITSNVNIYSFKTKTELYEYLNEDETFINNVTGNIDGSYTYDREKAEENICHNLDLVQEAHQYFGISNENQSYDAETWDVIVRCYLLSEMLDKVLDDMGYTDDFFNEATSNIVIKPDFDMGMVFFTDEIENKMETDSEFKKEIYLLLNRYCLKEATDKDLSEHYKDTVKTITIDADCAYSFYCTLYGKIKVCTDFERGYTYVMFENEITVK